MGYAVTMKRIQLRDVPDDLHLRFKLRCVERGISMNQALIDMIRREVAKANRKR